jgi:predicted alpha/beta-fold hydrolase
VADEKRGPIELSGQFLTAQSNELLIALHGLGGSVQSLYLRHAVSAAAKAGVACLLLNARGADGTGSDFCHAGLTTDIDAALNAPSLKRFSRVYLLGYSIGGHVALRYATRQPNERLKAVVALCSPLDLERSMHAFDGPPVSIYRHYVLGALRQVYGPVARQQGLGLSAARIARIRRILEWDELVVAPRFGYPSAWEYYQRESVAAHLPDLKVPALYVGTRGDPMVPLATVSPALERPTPRLSVHLEKRGGHLAFHPELSLGLPAARGVEPQSIAWLRQHA